MSLLSQVTVAAGLVCASVFPLHRALYAAEKPDDIEKWIQVLLTDKKAGNRYWATIELGCLRAKKERVSPPLRRALKDPEADVRGGAARALGCVGDAGAIPDLRRLLRDDSDINVRLGCIEGLGWLGPKAKVAVPDVVIALESDALNRVAIEALARIGPGSLDALVRVWEDPKKDVTVRERALSVVGRMDALNARSTRVAVPALLKALKDRGVAREAADVLGRVGAQGPQVVTALETLLEKGPLTGRGVGAQVLYKLQPGNAKIIPALLQAMGSEDSQLRMDAIDCFVGMVPTPPEAVAALSNAIRDKDFRVRRRVLAGLKAIKGAAIDAIPALEAAIKDTSYPNRSEASAALRAIRPRRIEKE